MNIIYLVIGLVLIYFIFKSIRLLGNKPVIFKNISLENWNDLMIFFRILLYRGYALRGRGDGRLYFKTTLNPIKQIIIRKYNFRNEIGLIIYIPLYSKQIEKKIRSYLGSIKFKYKIWKETRREVEEEVLGVDLKQDVSLGVKIFQNVQNIIFSKNDKEDIQVYFKNTGEIEEYYDFDLNKEEPNEHIRRKLDIPVTWSANSGYKIGKIFSIGRR